ncbi:MAG TPA: universal stress protein [Gemmatimonadaceae bacterium]|nr:universal stress protein [Gemmatimonadaceae bacterium]
MRHILFPYDFSEQGRQAVPFVTAYARHFGAKVTLLSAVPPAYELVPAAMGGPALYDGETSADWRRALKCQLDRALVPEFAGLEVERVADAGDAALRIADFAHRHDVDLVMMPTHGLGMFRRVLAGSVTSKVLHDVRCPVWTAAHAERQHAPAIPRTVLCAVDAKTEGIHVLQFAALFCRQIDASLTVLHVVEPMSDWPELARERVLQEEAREAASQAVASMLAEAGVEAKSTVVVGEIVARAAETAKTAGADLMIVGRGAIAEPFGRIRTHAFGIIEQSPCPVLSV